MPVAKSGEGAGGAGGKIKGDSLFGSILKEEEELEMIKSLPADSALRFTSLLDIPHIILQPGPSIVYQSHETEAFGGHDRPEVRDAEDQAAGPSRQDDAGTGKD